MHPPRPAPALPACLTFVIFRTCAPRHLTHRHSHCRQQTGLGYASGDDPEMSGPLDTQAPSFTANPPISSTGNTSPTQESSVMGVTAQLGMRLNELRGMQSEHEKLARGDRRASCSESRLGDGVF